MSTGTTDPLIEALEKVVSVSEDLLAAYSDDNPLQVTRKLSALEDARSTLRDVIHGLTLSANETVIDVRSEAEPLIQRANQLEREIATQLFGSGTAKRFGEEWLQNMFRNMAHLETAIPCNSLAGAFPSVPAFIVAAGPSMERNVDELRQAEGRGIIFAINRTFRALTERGLHPDFVVAIDSQEVIVDQLESANVPPRALVARLSCHPRLFTIPRARTLAFADTIPEALLFTRLGLPVPWLPSGGTVAHTAFSLANLMGCNPIVLVGQDLAYTEDKAHATTASWPLPEALTPAAPDPSQPTSPASSEPAPPPESTGGFVHVPGYHGGTVRTTAAMRAFIDWYAKSISTLRSNGVRVINASEGGARIQGALQMPLRAAVIRYCVERVDVAARLNSLQESLVSSDSLERLREEWRRDLKKAKSGAHRCHMAANAARKSPSKRSLARLERVKVEARHAITQIDPLVAHMVADISKTVRTAAGSVKTLEEGLILTASFYSRLSEVFDAVIGWLDTSDQHAETPTA